MADSSKTIDTENRTIDLEERRKKKQRAQEERSNTYRMVGRRKQRAGRRQKRKKTSGFFDYGLLAVVIILICFGLVMLYSASAYEAANDPSIGDDMYYFRRQAEISAAAVLIALLVSRIHYRVAVKLAPLLYVIALGLMAMVRFTPLGVTVNGARRWLSFGFVQFQPAEVSKIAVICIIPFLILKFGKKWEKLRYVLAILMIGMIQAAAAFFFTENLSTAVIIFGICFLVIFIAHSNTWKFLLVMGGGAGFTAAILAYINRTVSSSTNFRARRILAWLQPENNLNTGGYQVLQGLYAIGSGGFFGKGLGNSTQKLSTIPEAQNDMIFSIICEELGLFGAVIVLLLFGYLLYRLFCIAQNAKDLCGSLLVIGIFVHISLQVILNICVVLNLIPTTGVTLPFVSYGGTSVVFLMIEIGLALSVSRYIPAEELEEAKGIDKKQANKYTFFKKKRLKTT